MPETVNAFHVAPTGYTRTYLRFSGSNDPRTGRAIFDDVPVALGGDVIALILDREDGSVVEYVTADQGPEVAGLAHDGAAVILESADFNHPALSAIISEAEIYADCFNVTLSDKWPSA